MRDGFTTEEIMVAVREKDFGFLTDTLAKLGFENKDSRPMFTKTSRVFMSTLYNHAAIAAMKDDLDPKLFDLLIERTLPAVNIFDFISLYLSARGISEDATPGQFPENVRRACDDDEYTEEIGEAIRQMNSDEIEALLCYILDKESIDIGFSDPIIRNIRAGELLSEATLVMIMGFSVKESKDSEMMSELGGLLALGSLFG